MCILHLQDDPGLDIAGPRLTMEKGGSELPRNNRGGFSAVMYFFIRSRSRGDKYYTAGLSNTSFIVRYLRDSKSDSVGEGCLLWYF